MEINDRRGYRVRKRATANNGHSLDDHRAPQIEPTTAAQPSRRERLFMAPKRSLGVGGMGGSPWAIPLKKSVFE
jgi:hypothetical protein